MKAFEKLFIASILALACAVSGGTLNQLSAEQGLTLEDMESMKNELISDHLSSTFASMETVSPALNSGDFPPELMEFIPEGISPDELSMKGHFPCREASQCSQEEARFFALATKKFGDLISELDGQGASFDEIFQQLCRHAVSSDSLFININPRFKIRAMFMGLYKWTKNGGEPEFQERGDLALHFIYGGMIESYFSGFGYIAAYEKEKRDAHKPGNSFDLDDMGATMLGARWAYLAGRGFWVGTRWVKPWASGEKSLDKSIPKLRFGRLAHGQIASRTQVKVVKQFVKSAISADSSFPDNSPSI